MEKSADELLIMYLKQLILSIKQCKDYFRTKTHKLRLPSKMYLDMLYFVSIFNLLIFYCRQVKSTEIGGGNLNNQLFTFKKKIVQKPLIWYNIHGTNDLCSVWMNGHETIEYLLIK